MTRRWFIRGLALTLLTICVVAWAGSYGGSAGVEHLNHWWYQISVAYGRISIERHAHPLFAPYTGWHTWFLASGRLLVYQVAWTELDRDAVFHFAGFSIGSRIGPEATTWVHVPLWFVSVILTSLLWFVWRRTKPKSKAMGFPVEAAGKAATTSPPP